MATSLEIAIGALQDIAESYERINEQIYPDDQQIRGFFQTAGPSAVEAVVEIKRQQSLFEADDLGFKKIV